jgi:hypothetical protein
MVLKALQSSVRELIDGEAGRVMISPTEKLARTQTLFLYQIIRLLDGDVMLRAQGERDIMLLQTWLQDLHQLRDNLGNLALLGDTALRQQAPMEWEVSKPPVRWFWPDVGLSLLTIMSHQTWIFAESVRRTIFIAHSFITLYDMLRNFESTGTIPPSLAQTPEC